jgi:hypothetical protein
MARRTFDENMEPTNGPSGWKRNLTVLPAVGAALLPRVT